MPKRRVLAWTLAAVAFALAIGELAARRILPPTLVTLLRPGDDPEIPYEFRPGAKMTFEGSVFRIPPTEVTINSRGYRTREWRTPKPPGVTRVVCLGDSVTWGWGVEEAEAWPAQLEARLRALAVPGAEVLSLGMFGLGTRKEAAVLETDGLAAEPDAVVVQFSSNDFGRGGPRFLFGSVKAACVLRRSALYRAVRLGQAALVDALAPKDDEGLARERDEGVAHVIAGLLRIGEALRAAGVPGVFLYRNDGADGVEPAEAAARDAGFILADYTRAWSEGGPGLEIPRDGHPTPAGHAILAQSALGALAPALERRPAAGALSLAERPPYEPKLRAARTPTGTRGTGGAEARARGPR